MAILKWIVYGLPYLNVHINLSLTDLMGKKVCTGTIYFSQADLISSLQKELDFYLSEIFSMYGALVFVLFLAKKRKFALT